MLIANWYSAFSNNGTFISSISKIKSVLFENTEDLDVVISMYSLIEYSKNYRKTTSCFSHKRRKSSKTKKKKNAATGASFKIKETKLYVPVVNFSTENDHKLLELKRGFKRTIESSRYRPEMSSQTKNNNLNYLIDPTFTKVIYYLSYHLKMKMIELLFQSIIHQVLE